MLVLVINNVSNLEVNCYICGEGKQIWGAISLFFWSSSNIRDLSSLYFLLFFDKLTLFYRKWYPLLHLVQYYLKSLKYDIILKPDKENCSNLVRPTWSRSENIRMIRKLNSNMSDTFFANSNKFKKFCFECSFAIKKLLFSLNCIRRQKMYNCKTLGTCFRRSFERVKNLDQKSSS